MAVRPGILQTGEQMVEIFSSLGWTEIARSDWAFSKARKLEKPRPGLVPLQPIIIYLGNISVITVVA